MEDFVRKTKGVRDITSLPLDTSHELDIVSDVKGKIYIKILNRYKELLFDNGTDQWVIDMLNNLEVDVEQLKEDILDVEQALSELPIIEDKLATVETTLAQINTLFAQMQIDVQGLDLRTAELEREVVQLALKDQELLDKINNLDLGKITTLYSNSIDFGGYDYSGNPNLMKNVTSDSWSKQSNGISQPTPYTKIFDNYIIIDATDPSAANVGRNTYVPRLTQLQGGKKYTMSVSMMVDEDFNDGGDISYNKSTIHFGVYADGKANLINVLRPNTTMVNQYQRAFVTFTMPTDIKNVDYTYLQVYEDKIVTGKWYIKNDIKIEESSTATPYQPNLLDEPYCLSKVPLGENIADPTVKFPIKTSNNLIYIGDMEEPFIIGETYTLTIKATKPATQAFRVYNYGIARYGDMIPVEGLTDVWQLTFTVSEIYEPYPSSLTIYQQPKETVGACQIDWLKIEKGDTRTPNIPYHKYVGINLKESENPNDYQWIPLAKSAETVDARLTKTISTYDTVNALQNNRLTSLESKVVDTTWQNVTVTEPFTSVTQPQVKKQNGIVYMRGTISNGTGDCFTLPEGFRPPAGAYEMQFRLPCRSASAEDYATLYVRPSGLCSIAGVNGTKPIFLSGIIFSTT